MEEAKPGGLGGAGQGQGSAAGQQTGRRVWSKHLKFVACRPHVAYNGYFFAFQPIYGM